MTVVQMVQGCLLKSAVCTVPMVLHTLLQANRSAMFALVSVIIIYCVNTLCGNN